MIALRAIRRHVGIDPAWRLNDRSANTLLRVSTDRSLAATDRRVGAYSSAAAALRRPRAAGWLLPSAVLRFMPGLRPRPIFLAIARRASD